MKESANFLLDIYSGQFVLELSPEQHVLIPFQVNFFGDFFHQRYNYVKFPCGGEEQKYIYICFGKSIGLRIAQK
jgi:hypothetical protein